MTKFIGRLHLAKQLDQADINQNDKIIRIAAIKRTKGGYVCQRCLNQDQNQFAANFCDCQTECVYCLACLSFGKIRSCDYFYYQPALDYYDWGQAASYCQWPGKLSAQQDQGAQDLLRAWKQQNNHLVWAVTGAGKTEMTFPLIDQVICQGLRVVIATPRIDVANELFPRIQAAFPDLDILLAHSQSDMAYRLAPITVCATHQLVHFKAAFDLVIIDEIDAFPFHGNPMLQAWARRSQTAVGVTVWLTATPSDDMIRAAKSGRLSHSILPARYHRHALPVPRHIWLGDWRQQVSRGRLPGLLYRLIEAKLAAQRRFLIFFPHIQLMSQAEAILHRYFPQAKFTSVSSKDTKRADKVQTMRDEGYDFMLTTMILERGVTFVAIDVLIVGSEDRTFTQSSLVQIAGRVGRKPSAPTGQVYFLHYGKTRASRGAIKQITAMNRLARQRGLIDD
ncbi:competence protein ComF [Aerococcus urinaehominis]|uniref:Competence protein ComF n=1 Tax=Aerococcus urinaehominis TaxID=128944 RepID=A0A109RHU3_9LACT|nr:DEAD/DEAH box helicase [Aerococcus urinaehominis]AMB99416.1 competence protein ComF [Aerococcus urinaehominis]SDM29955.1 competence protein ComFA [Aerococcus urinaehominis]